MSDLQIHPDSWKFYRFSLIEFSLWLTESLWLMQINRWSSYCNLSWQPTQFRTIRSENKNAFLLKQVKKMNRAIPEADILDCFKFQVCCFIIVAHETMSTQKIIWSLFPSLDCLYFWRHGARLVALHHINCRTFYCLYLFCGWGAS